MCRSLYQCIFLPEFAAASSCGSCSVSTTFGGLFLKVSEPSFSTLYFYSSSIRCTPDMHNGRYRGQKPRRAPRLLLPRPADKSAEGAANLHQFTFFTPTTTAVGVQMSRIAASDVIFVEPGLHARFPWSSGGFLFPQQDSVLVTTNRRYLVQCRSYRR